MKRDKTTSICFLVVVSFMMAGTSLQSKCDMRKADEHRAYFSSRLYDYPQDLTYFELAEMRWKGAEAIRLFKSCLRERDDKSDMAWRLGEVYRYLHNIDEIGAWQNSKKYLDMAINLDPKSISAIMNLATLYLYTHPEYADKAIAFFQLAIKVSENGPSIPQIMGIIQAHLMRHDFESVKREAEKFLKKYPNIPEVNSMLGIANEKLNSGIPNRPYTNAPADLFRTDKLPRDVSKKAKEQGVKMGGVKRWRENGSKYYENNIFHYSVDYPEHWFEKIIQDYNLTNSFIELGMHWMKTPTGMPARSTVYIFAGFFDEKKDKIEKYHSKIPDTIERGGGHSLSVKKRLSPVEGAEYSIYETDTGKLKFINEIITFQRGRFWYTVGLTSIKEVTAESKMRFLRFLSRAKWNIPSHGAK